jgi:hypothetical protein
LRITAERDGKLVNHKTAEEKGKTTAERLA